LTKRISNDIITPVNVCVTEVKFEMDQIIEMIKGIDWEQVIATVKDIVAKIEESGIIDKAIAAVKDLIAMIAG
jgi:hypothetical protein